ncbi:lipase family protein, partial [Pseudomonas viridiflava]|uniref:lipase family protein n=1 Tax=Pseudomonas viridiflava TaxID=33069 RepID=UPI003BF5B68D
MPFNDRYTIISELDTAKAVPPEGATRPFYAISATQVMVAWRGTEMSGFADLNTDVTFRPVAPEVAANCEPKVSCVNLTPEGSVHLGFRNAYEAAMRIYAEDICTAIADTARFKELFICGHSLG